MSGVHDSKKYTEKSYLKYVNLASIKAQELNNSKKYRNGLWSIKTRGNNGADQYTDDEI